MPAPSGIATAAGVNVAGYLRAESGIGTATRGYVRALRKAGVQVALNNFETGVDSRKSDSSAGEFAQNNPYPVNLICVNADQMSAFVETLGEEYFRDKYNIGVWWWELPEFPVESWSAFRWFDEIWVGSSFVQQSLSACSPVPVVLVPPSIELPKEPMVDRDHLNLPCDEFLFLFMFDFFSSYERKNLTSVIRAFKKAFNSTQPVRLVLKCINSARAKDKLQQLVDEIGDSKVTIIDQYYSAIENTSLVHVCDAYVSLHRSEGLGLPIAEAMLLRKPVIATGWSGNIDFMNAKNSYAVPYELVVNAVADGPYQVGETWADPDIDAAAEFMQEVFSGSDASKMKAARASVDAAIYFSDERIGSLISNRLAAIKSFNAIDNENAKANLGTASDEIAKGAANIKPSKYQLDGLTQSQLDAVANRRIGTGSGAVAKQAARGFFMTLVEKAGYLNTIYSKLFEKLFQQYGEFKARIDLIDARTRRQASENDARIRAMEAEIRAFHDKLSDK